MNVRFLMLYSVIAFCATGKVLVTGERTVGIMGH